MERLPKLMQSLNHLLDDAKLEEQKSQLRSQELANSSESISQSLHCSADKNQTSGLISMQQLENMLHTTRYQKIGDKLLSMEKRLQALEEAQMKVFIISVFKLYIIVNKYF